MDDHHAAAEDERRPVNRGDPVLVDNQPQELQYRMPDPTYARSVEGVLRLVAVVGFLHCV